MSPLLREELAPDPIEQFRAWMSEAMEAGMHEPTAMALCTASAGGAPSARMVLLKAVDDRGFVFATNYESRKAGELEQNPTASLLFYWGPMDRQVRVEGRVDRADSSDSDAIYARRPRGARLAAWASPQSRTIAGREELDRRVAELDRRHPGETVPRPPHWGAYRVAHETIEFWQGSRHRLHDRLVYRRDETGWTVERLAP